MAGLGSRKTVGETNKHPPLKEHLIYLFDHTIPTYKIEKRPFFGFGVIVNIDKYMDKLIYPKTQPTGGGNE